jgi:hypothetical protein
MNSTALFGVIACIINIFDFLYRHLIKFNFNCELVCQFLSKHHDICCNAVTQSERPEHIFAYLLRCRYILKLNLPIENLVKHLTNNLFIEILNRFFPHKSSSFSFFIIFLVAIAFFLTIYLSFLRTTLFSDDHINACSKVSY